MRPAPPATRCRRGCRSPFSPCWSRGPHRRLALPVACLVLVLVAFRWAYPRARAASRIFCYYLTFITMVRLARAGALPVEVSRASCRNSANSVFYFTVLPASFVCVREISDFLGVAGRYRAEQDSPDAAVDLQRAAQTRQKTSGLCVHAHSLQPSPSPGPYMS
jgi:hypothetical protein